MADPSTVDATWHASDLRVAVRRPLHSPNPSRRLRTRWRARTARRRAARADRKQRGEASRWWEAFDVPFGDLDAGAAVLVAIVAAILLVLFLVFAGPFLWILALFVIDLMVWFIVAVLGVAAWLLLGRPWQVVITDPNDNTVASVRVRGRKRAREHAAIVKRRLAGGASPTAAITMTAI